MATIAEQLHEEGYVKGRAEGRAEGRRGVVLRLLRARFQELPEGVVTRVREADEAQLDLWAERILTAENLGQVFSD